MVNNNIEINNFTSIIDLENFEIIRQDLLNFSNTILYSLFTINQKCTTTISNTNHQLLLDPN